MAGAVVGGMVVEDKSLPASSSWVKCLDGCLRVVQRGVEAEERAKSPKRLGEGSFSRRNCGAGPGGCIHHTDVGMRPKGRETERDACACIFILGGLKTKPSIVSELAN